MAKEALVKAAGALGHEIHLETQGTIGVENELTPQQIADADVVLLAVDVHIEGRERF
ncbi:MAG: PTS fructose transporter subunit IIB, partial [Atopobiaceae bacterium]|nr:PTS fructose transporter subunit IIB [Atopobiaceae bacterium]